VGGVEYDFVPLTKLVTVNSCCSYHR